METERYSPERWQERYKPVADWDRTYRDGEWHRLGEISQTARHAIVAGYVHKIAPRGAVLDAGCGEGVLIEYLDLSRIRYTGFDISPTAVVRARERYPDLNLFACSIDNFHPPENVRYDAVIFNDALSTLRNPMEAIDRYFSYLNAGGYLIVSQFQPQDPEQNGAIFTQMFEAELAAGRYRSVVRSELVNLDTRLRWRSYCLQR